MSVVWFGIAAQRSSSSVFSRFEDDFLLFVAFLDTDLLETDDFFIVVDLGKMISPTNS